VFHLGTYEGLHSSPWSSSRATTSAEHLAGDLRPPVEGRPHRDPRPGHASTAAASFIATSSRQRPDDPGRHAQGRGLRPARLLDAPGLTHGSHAVLGTRVWREQAEDASATSARPADIYAAGSSSTRRSLAARRSSRPRRTKSSSWSRRPSRRCRGPFSPACHCATRRSSSKCLERAGPPLCHGGRAGGRSAAVLQRRAGTGPPAVAVGAAGEMGTAAAGAAALVTLSVLVVAGLIAAGLWFEGARRTASQAHARGGQPSEGGQDALTGEDAGALVGRRGPAAGRPPLVRSGPELAHLAVPIEEVSEQLREKMAFRKAADEAGRCAEVRRAATTPCSISMLFPVPAALAGDDRPASRSSKAAGAGPLQPAAAPRSRGRGAIPRGPPSRRPQGGLNKAHEAGEMHQQLGSSRSTTLYC
jgi:hypothetical protein